MPTANRADKTIHNRLYN